ncbi:unnamed protein product [Rotaria sp. Silwood2]|nr:unnamed protein product [Rotaria sp. Silwood2]
MGSIDNNKRSFIHNSQERNHYQSEIDPNDRISVELWNKLNEEDIKNIPIIDDYSNEHTATQWLTWSARIAQRYNQIDKALINQTLIRASFTKLSLTAAKKFNEYMKYSQNEDLKRIFGRLALGTINNNEDDLKKTSQLQAEFEDIYATTKVCESNDPEKCYTLSPYLERSMQIEKDYGRLIWTWKGWHDSCGNKEPWIAEYEMGDTEEFEEIINQLLNDTMPLYEQLHAYVRGRLCSIYPNRFNCHGPIPAHILGNMWAQQWNDRFDDLTPYSDAPLVNITGALIERGYTVHRMFTTAESFLTSIDLYPMTSKFWTRSLFEKPTDCDVVCHASAHFMQYQDDFRVKMCTEVNDDHFDTVHHELGHIEYFMAYDRNQPYVYQEGANAGFHEAIGDTIGIFAISPTHLITLGFLDENVVNSHYEINYLLRLALQKVAFLSFAYVMDKYRFLLFRDEINHENDELNSIWWTMRMKHGGIMPPVPRNDKENFDAGAKYHIPSNVPYLRYFIAHILEFQLYRSMCQLQGVTERFHMCDIYGNKYVGEKLKNMLDMGNSKSWSEVLQSLNGETKLDSGAMLDFFQPLYEWLKKENHARGYPVGWN